MESTPPFYIRLCPSRLVIFLGINVAVCITIIVYSMPLKTFALSKLMTPVLGVTRDTTLNVTGDVTGDVSGNVTRGVTGNVIRGVTSKATRSMTGNVTRLPTTWPISSGKIYTSNPVNHHLRINFAEYNRILNKRGFESTELHDFKSVYIVDPNIYSKDLLPVKPPGKRKTKILTCYNCHRWFAPYFSSKFTKNFDHCPYSECYFDSSRKNYSKADVVIFFPGMKQIPTGRPPGQIWAYSSWESPSHYSYPRPYPAWQGLFNWTISYRVHADIFIPYSKLAWRNSADLLPDSEYLRIAKAKPKNVAWFVSNCRTPSRRRDYVRQLQKYISVDIYGKCVHKPCPKPECLKVLNKTYIFYLSFENSICQDYASEKLFKIFIGRNHVIPVVRGGMDCKKYLPPNSYIEVKDFKSPKELALHLKALSTNYEKIAQMFKEKDRLLNIGFADNWCKICEKLHTGLQPKRIADVKKYSTENVCWHKFNF